MTTDTINDAKPADVDPWQMAYSALFALGLTPGLRVATSWLYAAMGISKVPTRRPGEPDAQFAARAMSWNLRVFKPQTDALVDRLLSDHGLYFRALGTGPNRPGEWELVDASAAPDVADRAIKTVRKTLRDSIKTIGAMRVDGLTDAQRAASADAAARLNHIATLVKTSTRKRG